MQLPPIDWATSGFRRFTELWDFSDFWTRGNTFDAAVHLVAAAKKRAPADPDVERMVDFLERTMIPGDLQYLTDSMKRPAGIWADDFGWWGIACLAARDYLTALGDTSGAAAYLAAARACWDQMIAKGYDQTTTARPVPHGCGNNDRNDGTGTKNTVTNANLFLLSVRLASAVAPLGPAAADPYVKMAYDQFLWFRAWMQPTFGYFRHVGHDAALVQERPMSPPNYINELRPKWEPYWTWSADQGLMMASLRGLVDIRAQLADWARRYGVPGFDYPALQRDCLVWSDQILTGVTSLLFGGAFSPSDGVLREAPFTSSFSDDGKDYVCGRGVLMRYLVELNLQDSLAAQINATATAVWEGATTGHQFSPRWNPGGDAAFIAKFTAAWGYGDPVVDWDFGDYSGTPVEYGVVQAAGLDVLTAAISAAPVPAGL